jgi:hypothetical protein
MVALETSAEEGGRHGGWDEDCARFELREPSTPRAGATKGEAPRVSAVMMKLAATSLQGDGYSCRSSYVGEVAFKPFPTMKLLQTFP